MSDAPSGTRAPQGERAAPAAVHYVLVALLAGVVMFWRLGAPALEDHECKAALAARTMAEPNLWLTEGVLGETAYEIPPNTRFNHWMVPVENGRPRLGKTPLEYWLVAALAGDGEGVNGWTARLPAAIAGVLCVLATLALGRRMFSPRAALYGAVMLATCLGFQKWGRSARPEMTLCFLVTAAMACFYFGATARSRGRHVAWMAAFWVSMGLANLSKEFVPLLVLWGLLAWLFWRQSDADSGPQRSGKLLHRFLIAAGVGLAFYLVTSFLFASIPALARLRTAVGGGKLAYGIMAAALGVPMAAYFFAARGWKPVVRLAPTAGPGLAVMAAMFLPWFFHMGKLFPRVAGNIFSNQVSERAAGTGGWEAAPPYFYLVSIVVLLLPWLAFVPGAFAAPLMKRFGAHRGALLYLLLWSVAIVMLFTYIAGKREHYILPMIPAACLLMGFVAEDVLVLGGAWVTPAMARALAGLFGRAAPNSGAGGEAARPAAGRALAMSYGLVAPIGIVVALAVGHGWAQKVHLLVVAAAGGIPLVIGAVLAYRRRLTPMVGCIAIAMAAAYTAFNARVELWDLRDPVREFGLKAAQIVPPGAPVYQWEEPQAKVPFYFGRYIPAMDWQFLRMRDLWVREGLEPNAAAARMERTRRDWLADTANAPWIFSYEEMLDRTTGKVGRTNSSRSLEELGFHIEYSQKTKLDRKYVFTLYHRPPAAATKPGP